MEQLITSISWTNLLKRAATTEADDYGGKRFRLRSNETVTPKATRTEMLYGAIRLLGYITIA